MDITWTSEKNAVMFSVSGALVRSTAEKFAAAVKGLSDMIKDLVVDCAKITFIDLEGLRQLVIAQKYMEQKGSFSLVRVPGVVSEALYRTGLNQRIRVLL